MTWMTSKKLRISSPSSKETSSLKIIQDKSQKVRCKKRRSKPNHNFKESYRRWKVRSSNFQPRRKRRRRKKLRK